MKIKKVLLLAVLPLLVLTGCGETPSGQLSSEAGSASVSTSVSTSTSVSSSSKAPVPVTEITADFASAEIEVGEKKNLNAAVTPANADKKGMTFTSSDANVATVSDVGVITGVGLGTCNITITSNGTMASGEKATKVVAITVKATAISDLTIDFAKAQLKEGETKQINAVVLPANATEKRVSYASDNGEIATVSDAGLITAIKAGTCKVTVTSVGKNAQDAVIVKEIAVTVESVEVKHKVTFRNYDGSIIQAVDDVVAGDVPAFTEDIPHKPTDAENIYVFRGFDKEIVAYADSEEEVVYNAVYEGVKSQAELVTLVSEDGKPTIYVKGEAIGATEESVAGKNGIQFMKHGDNWSTATAESMNATFNADGTWTLKATIPDELDITPVGRSFDWIGRYIWDGADAEDLKVHHVEKENYRHDASGKVLELKDSGYTDEEKAAYDAAIKGPTWVGLGLTYEENTVSLDGIDYKLFSNEDNWNCVAINVVDTSIKALVASSATLVNIDGVVNYHVRGKESYGFAEGDLEGFQWDFQHNSNLDGKGWDTPDAGTDAKGHVNADSSWYANIPVSSKDALKAGTEEYKSVFTIHFGGPDPLTKGDLKVDIDADYEELTVDGYVYGILKNSDTWDIPALTIIKAA